MSRFADFPRSDVRARLDEGNFRAFVYENPAMMHLSVKPDSLAGTVPAADAV